MTEFSEMMCLTFFIASIKLTSEYLVLIALLSYSVNPYKSRKSFTYFIASSMGRQQLRSLSLGVITCADKSHHLNVFAYIMTHKIYLVKCLVSCFAA